MSSQRSTIITSEGGEGERFLILNFDIKKIRTKIPSSTKPEMVQFSAPHLQHASIHADNVGVTSIVSARQRTPLLAHPSASDSTTSALRSILPRDQGSLYRQGNVTLFLLG